MQPPTERQILYRRLLNTEDGRRFIRDLTSEFDLNAPCFQKDFNSHKAAQRDGEKNVLKFILVNSTPAPNSDEN